jgi:predicted site-specific integrase-resolvase
MTADPDEVAPEAAARLLGIALPTLRRLIRSGALPPDAPRSRAALLAWRDRQALLRRDALASSLSDLTRRASGR